MYPSFILSCLPKLIFLFGFEILAIVITCWKFGKIPAPHNLLSKMWGCLVLISLCEIVLFGSSNVFFDGMIFIGIISRIESLLIYSVLKSWDRDIPSLYHAYQLRLGKEIKSCLLYTSPSPRD